MAKNNPTDIWINHPNICECYQLPSRENSCMPLYSKLKIIISKQF